MKEGALDMESREPWPSISQAAKSLIAKLLVRDPSKWGPGMVMLGVVALALRAWGGGAWGGRAWGGGAARLGWWRLG